MPESNGIENKITGQKIKEFFPNEKVFYKYFSEGKIVKLTPEEIPPEVMREFENQTSRFVPLEQIKPENEGHSFYGRIDCSNEDVVYLVNQLEQTAEDDIMTYMLDTRKGDNIGYAIMRNSSSYLKDLPYVDYTETEFDFERQGLALRRLKIMNAISRAIYGKPLSSGIEVEPEAEKVWNKLVKEGLVKERKQNIHHYVFVK